jgi:hypothetical protein
VGDPSILLNNAGLTMGKSRIGEISDFNIEEIEASSARELLLDFSSQHSHASPLVDKEGWDRVIFYRSVAGFTEGMQLDFPGTGALFSPKIRSQVLKVCHERFDTLACGDPRGEGLHGERCSTRVDWSHENAARGIAKSWQKVKPYPITCSGI